MEILFLWVGLVFAWIGALILKFAQREFATAHRVDGEVIGYAPNTDSDGSRTYAPVIAFVHPVAGRRVLQSGISAGHFLYPVGVHVKVLTDPHDASRARLDGKAFLYFGLVFIAIGLGFCVLFFSIFDWGLFSIALAVLVSASIFWKGRKQRNTLNQFLSLSGLMRQALGGNVVEPARFDRSTLLSPEELSVAHRRIARHSVIGGVILLLLGAGGVVGSWMWTERRLAFLQRAVPTDGRIVDLAVSSDSDSTTYAPVVEFTPSQGATPIRFRHSVSSSHPSWKVGQPVGVLHDPADPSSAIIDQGWWTTAVPLIPGAVGAVFSLLGLYSLYSGRRQQRGAAIAHAESRDTGRTRM